MAEVDSSQKSQLVSQRIASGKEEQEDALLFVMYYRCLIHRCRRRHHIRLIVMHIYASVE